MLIREAGEEDVPSLAGLMGELGYETTSEEMRNRFNKIQETPGYCTFVADHCGKVVGMIGLCTSYFYEKEGQYARIVALVVDSRYRNSGVGKKLIQQAEQWAKQHDAVTIGLNSGIREERTNAHNFYLNMGYKEVSKGFFKSL
ncbi:GNAT family N-acetyltransferase [Salsuginibacillus kocurii]|uniref:GNAT family N-acetyltransferase n=1 Tax=Salsuginibacillus kocurii TaxID=427078 RepID=UPI000362CA0A|nr:GNAT family N-acetyltransferase [Salsuginibacillus kocurii]